MPKSNKTVNQNVPDPEKTADPQQIGSGRKAEDQALFGGAPDLRVDRTSNPASLAAAGSGLKLM